MRKVYVVGSGLTSIGALWNYGLRDLIAEAGLAALDEAGVDRVDAIFVGNMMSGILNAQENLGAYAADYLGLSGIPAFKVEAACGSGGAAVMNAAMAIKSGLFERVLVIGVEKMSDVTATEDVTSALATASEAEYELFWGASFVSLNALIMRAYADRYGLSEEDFGWLPILMHKNAKDVPYAQLRFPIDMEAYLKSPMIAEPIRLLDSAPTGDGAAALVLSPSDTKNEEGVSVELAGFWSSTDTMALYTREELLELKAAKLAAKRAFEMANISPSDLDVVEVHDAFSIMGYLNLEALGIVEPGKAHEFVKSGDAERNGSLPVNPEGGLKARGHPVGATGVYQIVEVYRQLAGKAGSAQVPDPNVGAAMNVGGTGSNVIVTVLRRVS